ncbi:protein shisa-9B-like [Xyrauchen texanus]|uniref:protein shisa-9B-like n=1 Tax=Xyrauchen texanus TaxID=154827 RepID=UPI0022421EF4|nr:protein shisa-9B-like [Xyrauchen texanus]
MSVYVEETAKEAWEAFWSPCEIEEDREVSSHRTCFFDGGGRGREPEMFIHCACLPVFGVDASVFADEGAQMNSVVPGSSLMQTMTQYPALGQVSHPYESSQAGKELNKYASLKAVAEKASENFYTNRRHLADLAAKGTLPLHSVSLEQEPTNPYSPELPCQKQNGQKSKSTRVHSSHPLNFGSNTIANPGMLKGWDATETLGHRHTYGPKKQGTTMEQVNELMSAHSRHYLPPHPYFVTNSKTEVTV